MNSRVLVSSGTATDSADHEIAERISRLCQKGELFQEQLQGLRQKRANLEERRRNLLNQKQEIEIKIQKSRSVSEETLSKCEAQDERTGALKQKLEAQAKRKKELHFANLWIRTGTACSSLHHILRLREDLKKLKDHVLGSHLSADTETVSKIKENDGHIVAALRAASRVNASTLNALGQEMAVVPPQRLTYAEKQSLRVLLQPLNPRDEDQGKLKAQLALLLCAAQQIEVPPETAALYGALKAELFGSFSLNAAPPAATFAAAAAEGGSGGSDPSEKREPAGGGQAHSSTAAHGWRRAPQTAAGDALDLPAAAANPKEAQTAEALNARLNPKP